jgi:hypothetical protein
LFSFFSKIIFSQPVMMHKRHFAVILALAACFILCSLPKESMAERAYFDITASEVRKIMVAVPNFSGDGQGPAVAQLLTKGFALHSFINVINSRAGMAEARMAIGRVWAPITSSWGRWALIQPE